MRTIERSSVFKRDYKRELKGQYRAVLEKELVEVLMALAQDLPLADKPGTIHLSVNGWNTESVISSPTFC